MTNTLNKIIHNGDEYEFPSGGGDVLVSDQANNIFTPGMKIWGGTESDYQSLTPDSNTAYLLLAGGPTPGGWQPGANTLAYYPLESDVNDYLGNYDGSLSSPISYSTVGGSLINTAYFGGPRMTTSLTTLPNTINFWLYKSSSGGDADVDGWKQYLGFNNVDGGGAICIRGTDASKSSGHFYMQVGATNTEYTYGAYTDTRVNICVTTDGTTRKLYINGSEAISASGGFGTAQTGFWLGLSPYDSAAYAAFGYYSHVILESTTWTAQEISDYFDQTKGDYGIS